MKKAKRPSKKAVWDALRKNYTPVTYTIRAFDPVMFAAMMNANPELIRGIKC